MRTHRLSLASLTTAALLALSGQAGAQCTEVTSGLLRPTGIVQSKKGNLIVAESGTPTPNTGRVSLVSPAGTRRTLITGLPSGIAFDVGQPSGPQGVWLRGRTLYVAVGVGDAVVAGPSQGTVRPNPTPASPILSSILAVHFSAAVESNTQGFTLTAAHHQALASGQPVTLTNGGSDTVTVEMIVNFPDYIPEPVPAYADNVRHSNPFASVTVGNRLYVTDGARNLVWSIDLSSRQFSVLASFDRIANPQFNPNPPPPSVGGPFVEAVPTGISYANGQLLVTLFRGFPFPAGTSSVVQVDPLTGGQSTLISGLKTAISALPVRTDDDPGAIKHLVLQHASGPLLAPPGLLLRFDTPAGPPTTLASCMTAPSAMTLDPKSGNLYVTEVAGRIVSIPVAAEALDSDAGLAPVVRNISARGRVQSGDNVLIGGFIVGQGTGGGAVKVVVRAIGPSLGAFGVGEAVADPRLTLFDANGVEVGRNDNWKGDANQPSQQAEILATGFAPQDDAESAIVATLPPGNYTAIVRSNGGPGIALVEVFHVQ